MAISVPLRGLATHQELNREWESSPAALSVRLRGRVLAGICGEAAWAPRVRIA